MSDSRQLAKIRYYLDGTFMVVGECLKIEWLPLDCCWATMGSGKIVILFDWCHNLPIDDGYRTSETYMYLEPFHNNYSIHIYWAYEHTMFHGMQGK